MDLQARILREQFVAIYSQPLLDNLRREVSLHPLIHTDPELTAPSQWLTRFDGFLIPRKKLTKAERALLPASSQQRGKYVALADVLPHPPPAGDFDVSIVKDSPYFFS